MRLAEIKEDDERTVINREQHEVPMQNEELYEEDHDTTPPPKPSTDAQKPVATAPVKNDEQRTFQTPVSIKGKVLKAEQKAMACKSVDTLDEVMDRVVQLEMYMSIFRHYVKSQTEQGKPLYKWSKYEGYHDMRHAARELNDAVALFKQGQGMPKFDNGSIRRAIGLSIAVSQSTTYVLATVNKKAAAYVRELESSHMSEEEKAELNSITITEVQKLVDHALLCAHCVWAATDLLQFGYAQSLPIESSRSGSGWISTAIMIILIAIVSAVTGIVTAYLSSHTGFGLTHSILNGGTMHNRVLDLVQHTQAVTNLSSELYIIKLQDIDQHYGNLSALTEANTLRIDNIVNALGPPNEDGMYRGSAPESDGQSCEEMHGRIKKLNQNADQQIKALQKELEMMRKTMHRLDIRLTTRLNKLGAE